MKNHIPRGATIVYSDPGEPLDVRYFCSNKVILDNGERVQIRRAESAGTPIAQSQTDSVIIAAPADATTYYALLYLHIMCDAATAVTLNTKGSGAGVAINGPWPLSEDGGFIKDYCGLVYGRTQPGEALTMTTGAGGNTSYEIHFIEVPLNVDLL